MRVCFTANVLAAAALSLATAPSDSLAKENRATISESKELAAMREKATHRQRRVIYNDDGCGPLWAKDGGNTPERFLHGPHSRMGAIQGTQVDSVLICSGATHVLIHPSSVAESYADIVDRYDFTQGNFDHFRDNMCALEALGTDAIKLTVDFCRNRHTEVFYTYRANDLHLALGGDMTVERSTWWREHPEYWLGKPANISEADSGKHPMTDPRNRGWASLKFELTEVRAYLLSILDEVANKYDVDGIEIDYLRAPLVFLPNLEGQPATGEQAAILTDFQRQVRLATLRAAERRGRAMLVAVRVPTDKAIAWIEKQPSDEPFFLYFTPVAVHEPSTPSEKVKGTSKAGPYGDWIHELDLSLGRVLDALDQRGQADRTLFIFASDNGGTITNRDNYSLLAVERGLAINGQWRDGKTSIYEGGFRVPFLVRWPGQVPPGTVCDETISLVDLFATVAAVVGDELPPPSMGAEDSYNVLPAFLGEESGGSMREHIVLHSWDGTFAIRQGPWKWIEGIPHKPGRKPNPQELYNLLEDPQETNNVLDKHPEVAKQLAGLLAKYRDQGNSR